MSLDRYIRFWQESTTRNEYNEPVKTLSLFQGMRASVNYKGGREGYYGRQVVATGDVFFTVRYFPGINERMFIEYGDRMYDIKHIEEIGRMQFLGITAKMTDNMDVPEENTTTTTYPITTTEAITTTTYTTTTEAVTTTTARE